MDNTQDEGGPDKAPKGSYWDFTQCPAITYCGWTWHQLDHDRQQWRLNRNNTIIFMRDFSAVRAARADTLVMLFARPTQYIPTSADTPLPLCPPAPAPAPAPEVYRMGGRAWVAIPHPICDQLLPVSGSVRMMAECDICLNPKSKIEYRPAVPIGGRWGTAAAAAADGTVCCAPCAVPRVL